MLAPDQFQTVSKDLKVLELAPTFYENYQMYLSVDKNKELADVNDKSVIKVLETFFSEVIGLEETCVGAITFKDGAELTALLQAAKEVVQKDAMQRYDALKVSFTAELDGPYKVDAGVDGPCFSTINRGCLDGTKWSDKLTESSKYGVVIRQAKKSIFRLDPVKFSAYISKMEASYKATKKWLEKFGIDGTPDEAFVKRAEEVLHDALVTPREGKILGLMEKHAKDEAKLKSSIASERRLSENSDQPATWTDIHAVIKRLCQVAEDFLPVSEA